MFVAGALPGERVDGASRPRAPRSFDEARTLEVLQASPDRVAPRCPHFGTCGGCALQHLDDSQADRSPSSACCCENLERIGHVAPQRVLPPLTDAPGAIAAKAASRCAASTKKDKTLVGFRESDPRFVADLRVCHTVIPQIGERIGALAALIDSAWTARATSRRSNSSPATTTDARWCSAICSRCPTRSRMPGRVRRRQHDFAILLQPGGVDSVHAAVAGIAVAGIRVCRQWDVELAFRPLDFIQVNAGLNQKMIARTLELLDPQPRNACSTCSAASAISPCRWRASRGEVVGVEGEAGWCARARANAAHNGLANAHFHAADLAADQRGDAWMRRAASTSCCSTRRVRAPTTC